MRLLSLRLRVGAPLLDLGALVPGGFERLLEVARHLARLAQPFVELLQHVRSRFEPLPLVAQRDDVCGHARPVQLLEVAELLQAGQCIELSLQVPALRLQLADQAADLGETRFELIALRFERGDLGHVRPPEHIAAAVGDRVRSSFSCRPVGSLI